jgi:hypothetical protein
MVSSRARATVIGCHHPLAPMTITKHMLRVRAEAHFQLPGGNGMRSPETITKATHQMAGVSCGLSKDPRTC